MRTHPSRLTVVALVAAVVVAVASTAQAVRERDLAPIASVGWLPAVLAAAFYRPRSGRCSLRVSRRSGT